MLTKIAVHATVLNPTGAASDPTWTNLKLEFKAANGAVISNLLSIPGETTHYKGKDGSNFNLPLKTYLEFLKSVGMTDVKELDKYTRALWKSFDATASAKITIQAVLGYKKGTFHLGLTKGSGYSINDFNGVALTNDNGLPMFFEDKPEALAEMSARGLKQGYVDIKYFKGQGTSNILPGVAKVLPKAAESDDTPF